MKNEESVIAICTGCTVLGSAYVQGWTVVVQRRSGCRGAITEERSNLLQATLSLEEVATLRSQ